MNILYVEDDLFDADLTRRWCTLKAPHITLDVVRTVTEARQRLRRDPAPPYDIILTDMRLPDANGLAVLRTVQDLALDIPVVMITGVGDEHTVVTALKAGAIAYVVKREDYLERLPATFENALRRYRSESARRAGPRRVLYAEPDAADAEFTQRHLAYTAPHFRLSVVSSGEAVLEQLGSGQQADAYHVLLLAYRLPGMDVLDLVKELWEVRQVCVPIVLVTGKGSEDAALQALRMGVNEYVVKEPGYLERLPWLLEQTITRAELLREQARLTESLQRFETFMNNSLVATTLRDAQGRLLYANPTFIQAFGVQAHTGYGHSLQEIQAQENAERLRAYGQEVLTSGTSCVVEESFVQADGVRHWLLTNFPVPHVRGEKLVGTVGVDITERRKAQEEVERRARQLHMHNAALTHLSRSTTLEQMGIEATLQEIIAVAAQTLEVERVSIWIYDAPRVQLLCRALYERTPARHSIGGVLLATTYPEYFRALESSRVIAAQQAHTDPRTREFSADYLSPLGITSMLNAPIRVLGRQVGVVCHEHMGAARTWSQEEETFAASVADFVSMAMEAEERRLMADAKLKLEEQLRQAHKMESLGTLAGGIAHDFNNILMSIFGNVSLATLTLAADHPVQERLTAILKASERARDLVQQILTFSRQQHQQRKPLHLQDVVTDALALLRPTLPTTIALHTDLTPEAPTILADPTQLHQVLMNLCSNAAQAIGQRSGSIAICQRTMVADDELVARCTELRAGIQYVQLTVQDNGPGMDAATLERIFDPFFTTKALGEGTGLGLAVVHGIMKSHDGAVTVTSIPDHGTTFTLFFPAVEAPVLHPLPAPPSVVQGTGQHILLLDDEEALTRLGQHILQQLGYTVTSYSQVPAALQAVQQAPYTFDLVITDFAMPGMNGLEVAQRLAMVQPQLPCILVTGYGSTLNHTTLQQYGIAAVLHKPFTVSSLGETIARVLGTGKAPLPTNAAREPV